MIDFVILAYLHGNAESLKDACVLWAITPIQLKFVVLELVEIVRKLIHAAFLSVITCSLITGSALPIFLDLIDFVIFVCLKGNAESLKDTCI